MRVDRLWKFRQRCRSYGVQHIEVLHLRCGTASHGVGKGCEVTLLRAESAQEPSETRILQRPGLHRRRPRNANAAGDPTGDWHLKSGENCWNWPRLALRHLGHLGHLGHLPLWPRGPVLLAHRKSDSLVGWNTCIEPLARCLSQVEEGLWTRARHGYMKT